MWLFDNIFLDEETQTAVMENPETDTQSAPETPSPEVGEVASPDTTTADIFSTGTPTGDQTQAWGENPVSEISSSPETTASTGDIPLSFDIGGDLDFSPSSTPATSDESTDSDITVQSTEITEITPTTTTEADTSTSTSFVVNGVEYSTNSEAANPPSIEEALTESSDIGSIAMIQWSTAASGISIIDESPSNVSESDSTIEILNEEPSSDQSLMNILSSEEHVESSEENIGMPNTAELPEQPDIASESLISPSEILVSDTIDTPTQDEKMVEPQETGILEEATHAPLVDPLAETDTGKNGTHELAATLEWFIAELASRETEINVTVMKMRELAKQRAAIEEYYKARLLTLNMEKEYLEHKAEREREAQDQLQDMIKTFQNQIALAE
jgi:hypothetical protein